MFERPHHRRIASVLESLDADFLATSRCYFGGGTAITLRHGEFRESVDIDGDTGRPATLTDLDLAASKLLANSDRWADSSVFSRDVIDLAMMRPTPDLLARAVTKAESAYGQAIRSDLDKAIDYLRDNPHRLGDCMRALQMDDTPRAVLWDRIKKLRR